MRLIDADKILYFKGKDIVGEEAYITQKDVIDEMPTVDAEPIIRCKECKYFMCGNGCILQAVDYSWEEQMYANDFCSRGERKDE